MIQNYNSSLSMLIKLVDPFIFTTDTITAHIGETMPFDLLKYKHMTGLIAAYSTSCRIFQVPNLITSAD